MDTIAIVTIYIKQGSDFALGLGWKPGGTLLNTAGYTARMQIRDPAGALQIELNTSNGRIAVGIDANNTNVRLAITAADTAALLDWGRGEYDLLITDAGGKVTPIAQGPAFLDTAATH